MTRQERERLMRDVEYSKLLRELAAKEPPRPIRHYTAEEHAKFLRWWRRRDAPRDLVTMPPVRTVTQQIVSLLLDD